VPRHVAARAGYPGAARHVGQLWSVPRRSHRAGLPTPRHWLAFHGGGTGRRFGAKIHLLRTHAGAYALQLRGRTIWRSHGLYPNDYTGVAFGPGLFAFGSYTHRGIFLTDLHGPERMVVRGRSVYVLDFTSRGDLLVSEKGAILVIAPSGKVVRALALARGRGYAFDEPTGTLYFVTRTGMLAALRERRVGVLGRAPRVRTNPAPFASGLLAWEGAHMVVLTDRVGREVASARWSPSLGTMDIGVSGSPDGQLFAYRVSRAWLKPPHTATLFVLRRGARSAQRILDQRVARVGCGGIPGGISSNQHHLLYDFGDGRVVVLDPDADARTSLSALTRTLPRRWPEDDVNVAWESTFSH
jgi:hypothetical protein